MGAWGQVLRGKEIAWDGRIGICAGGVIGSVVGVVRWGICVGIMKHHWLGNQGMIIVVLSG